MDPSAEAQPCDISTPFNPASQAYKGSVPTTFNFTDQVYSQNIPMLSVPTHSMSISATLGHNQFRHGIAVRDPSGHTREADNAEVLDSAQNGGSRGSPLDSMSHNHISDANMVDGNIFNVFSIPVS